MLQIIGMGPPVRYSWLLNLLFGQVMEMETRRNQWLTMSIMEADGPFVSDTDRPVEIASPIHPKSPPRACLLNVPAVT